MPKMLRSHRFHVLMTPQEYSNVSEVAEALACPAAEVLRRAAALMHLMVIHRRPHCANGQACPVPQVHLSAQPIYPGHQAPAQAPPPPDPDKYLERSGPDVPAHRGICRVCGRIDSHAQPFPGDLCNDCRPIPQDVDSRKCHGCGRPADQVTWIKNNLCDKCHPHIIHEQAGKEAT